MQHQLLREDRLLSMHLISLAKVCQHANEELYKRTPCLVYMYTAIAALGCLMDEAALATA